MNATTAQNSAANHRASNDREGPVPVQAESQPAMAHTASASHGTVQSPIESKVYGSTPPPTNSTIPGETERRGSRTLIQAPAIPSLATTDSLAAVEIGQVSTGSVSSLRGTEHAPIREIASTAPPQAHGTVDYFSPPAPHAPVDHAHHTHAPAPSAPAVSHDDLHELVRLTTRNEELKNEIDEMTKKMNQLRNAMKKGRGINLDSELVRSIVGNNDQADAKPPPEHAVLKKDLRAKQNEVRNLRKRWFEDHKDLDMLAEKVKSGMKVYGHAQKTVEPGMQSRADIEKTELIAHMTSDFRRSSQKEAHDTQLSYSTYTFGQMDQDIEDHKSRSSVRSGLRGSVNDASRRGSSDLKPPEGPRDRSSMLSVGDRRDRSSMMSRNSMLSTGSVLEARTAPFAGSFRGSVMQEGSKRASVMQEGSRPGHGRMSSLGVEALIAAPTTVRASVVAKGEDHHHDHGQAGTSDKARLSTRQSDVFSQFSGVRKSLKLPHHSLKELLSEDDVDVHDRTQPVYKSSDSRNSFNFKPDFGPSSKSPSPTGQK
jgi:hypothetical protein